jgi:ABC-type sugar transport system ATPase subunit
MSRIVIEGVSKSFGRHRVLDGVTLDIPSESLTVLCGPPQAGKSVLLRLLVGLETLDAGRMSIDGQDLAALTPAQRSIGYVPQSFALLPQMSVFDNIAYPLRMQKSPHDEIRRRVDEAAAVLRIGGLLEKRPDQLSGGEKQRVAIARGMLKQATVFVLDDPLVGLDFKLREALMDDLKDMRVALGATFVYATSDSLEALAMADRLAVLDAGRLIADGGPDQVYHAPPHLRAAELIGFPRCNMVAGRVGGGHCATVLGTLRLEGEGEVVLAIRPEQIRFTDVQSGGLHGVGHVALIENLGADSVVHFDVHEIRLVAIPSTESVAGLDVGDAVAFAIDPESLSVFGAATGVRLRQGVGA